MFELLACYAFGIICGGVAGLLFGAMYTISRVDRAVETRINGNQEHHGVLQDFWN